MSDTFEDAWRRARVLFPSVPALVVRDWVQDAYTKLCATRGGGWGFLRTEASIDTLAARTETITFTQSSATITSAAAFVASDAGRQLKVSTYPIYTILSVTNASLATLDRVYADTGGALDADIYDAYFTAPADFGRFIQIVDPYNQRTIPFWLTLDQLGVTDPDRTSSDTGPRALIPQAYSPVTATLGQVRFEYWPNPTSERHYPYLYYRKAERFTDATTLPGVLSNRADLLKLGAEVEAAMWPGTAEQKNPYYNLSLAQMLGRRLEIEVQQLSLADDNQYPEDLLTVHWERRVGLMAETTHQLRASDATVADYI